MLEEKVDPRIEYKKSLSSVVRFSSSGVDSALCHPQTSSAIVLCDRLRKLFAAVVNHHELPCFGECHFFVMKLELIQFCIM